MHDLFRNEACNEGRGIRKLGFHWRGGQHGFGGLQETGRRLWTDHGADSLSASGSPLAVADVRLAGLRSFSAISRVATLSRVLAEQPRRTPAFGDGGTFAVDPSRGNPACRRRIPAALMPGIGLQ